MKQSLPYRCPELRLTALQAPCAAKLRQLAELQAQGAYLGLLEKCRNCQGSKLMQTDVDTNGKDLAPEAAPKLTQAAITAPEAEEAPPPEKGIIQSPEKSSEMLLCKKCQQEPAIIDRMGRNMGFCRSCLAAQTKNNLAKGPAAAYTPCNIPLNAPRYAPIKEWLLTEAEEANRNLDQEIMYRLKLAMRQAQGGAEAGP